VYKQQATMGSPIDREKLAGGYEFENIIERI
jgi:hypothetical protein